MIRRPSVDALLSTYPRPRPALPLQQQTGYVEHYRRNRAAKRGLSRLVAKLESWMHRRVGDGVSEGRLLEIGAGNMNHVPFLPAATTCDAVEPFRELWHDSPDRSRMGRIYSSLEEIPPGAQYDCIFSIAVLEHLADLPAILARAGLLLRNGGTFRAGIPSEGGFLWGLSWRLTTAIEYRLRHGLAYGPIMRYEHLNSADEILTMLRYFYGHVEVSRFPLPFRHFSFYASLIASRPNLDRCRNFTASGMAARTIPNE